jgi:hypothetical protein
MSRAVGTTFTKRVPAFAPTCVVVSKQDGGAAIGTATSGATTIAASTAAADLSRTPLAWNVQGPLHQQQYLRSGRDQYPRKRKKGRDNWSVGKVSPTDRARLDALLQRVRAVRTQLRAAIAGDGTPPLERIQAPRGPLVIKVHGHEISISGKNANARTLMQLAICYPDYEWERAYGKKRLVVKGRDAYQKVLAALEPLGRIEHLPTGETPP